jgi:hypothetical protein
MYLLVRDPTLFELTYEQQNQSNFFRKEGTSLVVLGTSACNLENSTSSHDQESCD